MGASNRILIVDDNSMNVDLLDAILSDDYPLATAFSGEEALEVAHAFQPDLVLLDIMMPGIDGYETCRQMRATPALRYTKIIMVSAKSQVSERLKGYDAGANDYLIKPFDDEELLAKVRVYLQLKSLEEVDQLKSDMLTLLTHETATPLNGIMAPAQMLRDEPDMEPATRTELLELIYDSAVRLHALHAKIGTLSAMRAGRWTFEPVPTDLSHLVRRVVDTVASEAARRHVQLDLTLPENATTQLDPTHVQGVITALLDNAIRVSPEAGCVTVRGWCEQEQFCLTITDQGPGIGPALLPQLFEPLPQTDVNHHTQGAGLSLAIAQHVVEAHNGAIAVDSTPGEGTSFTVHLPIVSA